VRRSANPDRPFGSLRRCLPLREISWVARARMSFPIVPIAESAPCDCTVHVASGTCAKVFGECPAHETVVKSAASNLVFGLNQYSATSSRLATALGMAVATGPAHALDRPPPDESSRGGFIDSAHVRCVCELVSCLSLQRSLTDCLGPGLYITMTRTRAIDLIGRWRWGRSLPHFKRA